MFWQCHIVTSSIDKLFDKPIDELKLEDFLDENDLIQECLNHNKRLLDYLIQENVMRELIHHIITLPHGNNFRYSTIVSELLSGDFQSIQEKLLEKSNLDLLYSFLVINNDTLNPILASYFSRIINSLINRKPIQIINYFKSCETFKEDFFRHLDSTSITDILFHLISDCGEQRSDTIKWYEDINLIDGLMQLFLTTESYSVQANIANLLNEFLRLAFDQQTSNDCDVIGSTLTTTIEKLLYNMSEKNEGSLSSSSFSSDNENEEKTMKDETAEKRAPVVLAQLILSKSNLEQLFDTLAEKPILISNGYEFFLNIIDILSRYLPPPKCISLLSENGSSSKKNNMEQMQINDDTNTSMTNNSNENTSVLINSTKDPLLRIYLTLLEVLSFRLPSLIGLLSTPCPPLIPSPNELTRKIKYQFIHEPLGSIRLNLLKFFSKLINVISNDNTGDKIYEILGSNRFFHILIDLFIQYEYNNLLHTQVCAIICLLININSLAIKQPNDIWTRTSINNQLKSGFSKSSPYYYTNRYSYKSFQSLFRLSGVNLFERLLDQYELNIASTKTVATPLSENAPEPSFLHSPFVSPNSGHIAQLLRNLREKASTFNNYSSFFKSNDLELIDDDTSLIDIRWQAALDYLTEEEGKWEAMHYKEHTTSNFRVNSSASYLAHLATNEDDDDDDTEEAEAEQQQQQQQHHHAFQIRTFNKNTMSYTDEDDDDDEIERFDIDDELMKNNETSSEKKLSDMKKISFQLQFPSSFDEQSIWYEQDEMNETNKANDDNGDDENIKSTPELPNLFENHRIEQEESLSNESNFEQLCSIKVHDKTHGSGLFPFQSSSTIRDEAVLKNDDFWNKHQIYLIKRNDNQRLNESHGQYFSSSSDEDSDIDDNEDESKSDSNIPDDEKFFVNTDVETNDVIEPNNMMDIFRRQSSNPNGTTHNNNNLEKDLFKKDQENESQHDLFAQILSKVHTDENQNGKTLTIIEHDQQHNDNMNSDIDNDYTLQNNFSFLIAKGMLKPSSYRP